MEANTATQNLVITAIKANRQHTGRFIARATSREKAEREVARMASIGDYLRDGETFLIMDRAEFDALDKSQFVDHEPVATADTMKAAILGSSSVMNSDF
jgi:hypothetical protein